MPAETTGLTTRGIFAAGSALVVAIIIGFGIRTYQPLNPADRVVYDYESRTYVTWDCILNGNIDVSYYKNIFSEFDDPRTKEPLRDTASEMSLDEARRLAKQLGGGPDQTCKNSGGFGKESRLIYSLWPF